MRIGLCATLLICTAAPRAFGEPVHCWTDEFPDSIFSESAVGEVATECRTSFASSAGRYRVLVRDFRSGYSRHFGESESRRVDVEIRPEILREPEVFTEARLEIRPRGDGMVQVSAHIRLADGAGSNEATSLDYELTVKDGSLGGGVHWLKEDDRPAVLADWAGLR